MSGTFYIHFALNDPFEQMVPAFIFTLLIFTRFIILNQAKEKERTEKEKARVQRKTD